MKYVLGLGTNIGNKSENLKNCIEAINLAPKTSVLEVSSVYQTSPVGYAEQDDFYNCVLAVESELTPHEMLGLCLGIECGFGRVRTIKNGPRILDVDLLYAENEQINSPNLTLPHPRINERKFVIVPLLDLFPSGTAFGFNFAEKLDEIDGQEIRKVNK